MTINTEFEEILGIVLEAVYDEESNETTVTLSVPATEEVENGGYSVTPALSFSVDTFDYVRMVWRSRYDHNIQRFVNIGNQLFGFSRYNQLNINNTSSITFNGDTVREKIVFTTNAEPSQIKRFLTMVIKTTKKWFMPSATIEEGLSYSRQETSLDEAEFRVKENLVTAQFKRDINSPNFATPAIARIRGNFMRGQAMTISLDREVDGQTVTFSVVTTAEPSDTQING